MRRLLDFSKRLRAAPHGSAAQLTRGRRDALRGRHSRAVRRFTRAARAGSAAGALEMGRAYLLGLGVPSCPAIAVRWLSQAALAGESEAQLLLASLALQGITEASAAPIFPGPASRPGQEAECRLALYWSQRAADAGCAQAQALLGFILTAGAPALRDPERGHALYRQAAESGCPHGQLGWSLALLGADRPADLDQVRRLLEAAALADLPTAHCMLGILAESRIDDAEGLSVAARHYRKGAALGHAGSQLRYGFALLHGRGVPADPFQAETWLRRAALNDAPQAAAILGALYAQAGALPPNYAEAMIWFRRAAEAGHDDAARALAHLHLHGLGTGADPQEARRLLRQAGDRGNPAARAEHAALTLAGDGPEADRLAAVACLRERAETGDMVAAFNIGLCCAEGVGVPRDDEQAVAWFRRAARELTVAQYWYGRMLAEGRGTPQDLPAARDLFLRAAEQGLQDAEVVAGEMLANGRGGPRDLPTARVLFDRAAAAGHAGALYALGMLARGACGESEDRVAAAAFLGRAAEGGHPAARGLLAGLFAAPASG